MANNNSNFYFLLVFCFCLYTVKCLRLLAKDPCHDSHNGTSTETWHEFCRKAGGACRMENSHVRCSCPIQTGQLKGRFLLGFGKWDDVHEMCVYDEHCFEKAHTGGEMNYFKYCENKAATCRSNNETRIECVCDNTYKQWDKDKQICVSKETDPCLHMKVDGNRPITWNDYCQAGNGTCFTEVLHDPECVCLGVNNDKIWIDKYHRCTFKDSCKEIVSGNLTGYKFCNERGGWCSTYTQEEGVRCSCSNEAKAWNMTMQACVPKHSELCDSFQSKTNMSGNDFCAQGGAICLGDGKRMICECQDDKRIWDFRSRKCIYKDKCLVATFKDFNGDDISGREYCEKRNATCRLFQGDPSCTCNLLMIWDEKKQTCTRLLDSLKGLYTSTSSDFPEPTAAASKDVVIQKDTAFINYETGIVLDSIILVLILLIFMILVFGMYNYYKSRGDFMFASFKKSRSGSMDNDKAMILHM